MSAPRMHTFSFTVNGVTDFQQPFFANPRTAPIPAGEGGIGRPASEPTVSPVNTQSFQIRLTSAQLLDAHGMPPTSAFLRIVGFIAPQLEFGRAAPATSTNTLEHRNETRIGGARISLAGWSANQQNNLSVQQKGLEVPYQNTLTVPVNVELTNDTSLALDVRSLSNEATVTMQAVGIREVLHTGNAPYTVMPRFYSEDALVMQLVLLYD